MNRTLTRRDALAALAAGGVGIGGPALAVSEHTADRTPSDVDPDVSATAITTLVALTDVVYPSDVDTDGAFVRTYVRGLPEERRAGIVESVRRLDDGARRYAGREFAELEPEEREAVLDRMGVDTARSSPDGSPAQRVRYHLVNSLLYALFTTPTGSELVGIRNPTGYPGGYESLTRAPDGAEDSSEDRSEDGAEDGSEDHGA